MMPAGGTCYLRGYLPKTSRGLTRTKMFREGDRTLDPQVGMAQSYSAIALLVSTESPMRRSDQGTARRGSPRSPSGSIRDDSRGHDAPWRSPI